MNSLFSSFLFFSLSITFKNISTILLEISPHDIREAIKHVQMNISTLRNFTANIPDEPYDIERARRRLKLNLAPLFYPIAKNDKIRYYSILVSKHTTDNYDSYYDKLRPLIERIKHVNIEITDGNFDFEMNRFIYSAHSQFSPQYNVNRKIEELERIFHTDNILIIQENPQHHWLGLLIVPHRIYLAIDSIQSIGESQMWRFSKQYLRKFAELLKRRGTGRHYDRMENDLKIDFDNWKFLVLPSDQQKSRVGCPFFSMINIKYIVQRILPYYTESDVHQMRHALGYEIHNNQLYNLMVDQDEISTIAP
ncbi:hypothetical protein SNEBB_008847 [Seison nebaliae]|nr:hypothetical protein SNEBB_008847 [Seison nebaliae]